MKIKGRVRIIFILGVIIMLFGYNNAIATESNPKIKSISFLVGQNESIESHEITNDSIALVLEKDTYINTNNNTSFSRKYLLKIDTEGITDIEIHNKNDKYKRKSDGKSGIDKRYKDTAENWRKGIAKAKFGETIVGNKEPYGEIDYKNPPKLIFYNGDQVVFEHTLQFIEAFQLEVWLGRGGSKMFDRAMYVEINGTRDNYTAYAIRKFSLGDEVKIKANDSDTNTKVEKAKFKEWLSYNKDNNNKDINLSEYIGDTTRPEIEFKVTEEFKSIKDKLTIEAAFDFYSIINIKKEIDGESSPENVDGLIVESNKSKALIGDIVELKANSTNENYEFSHWEFSSPQNPSNEHYDINYKNPYLSFKMFPIMDIEDPETSYKLDITAYFKKKSELTMKEVLPIHAEYIIGYNTQYKLPSTIEVKMSDDSVVFKPVQWDEQIDHNTPGKQEFIGTIIGEENGPKAKLTLTVKKIISINQPDEYTQKVEYFPPDPRMHDLPKTATVKMSDGTNETEETVNIEKWNGKNVVNSWIQYYEYDSYTAEGSIKGFDSKVNYTLRVVPENEDPEMVPEIKTVELIKDGNVITSGIINNKKVTMELPKTMEPEEVSAIINGKYILRIVATDGANIKQDGGHDDGELDPKWSEGISNGIRVGESKKFTITKGDKSVDYTIEIVAPQLAEDEYTVTFNTDGGSNIDPAKVKKDEKANKPTDPTKENNKFLGWYEDSSFANVFNFSTSITKDMTLYAKWEKTEVTIESISEITEEVKIGSTFELPTRVKVTMNDKVEKSVDVESWNPTTADTSKVGTFKFEGTIEGTDKGAKLTLVVKAEDEYTVTFNSDGGSNIDSIKVKKDEKANRPTDPTKENNKFLGWYEDSNIANAFNFSMAITEDMTLYAKWEKIEVTIESIPEITKEAKVDSTFELPKMVQVIMSDKNKKSVDVESWNPTTADTSKVGTFKFEGTIEGTDKGVKLTLTVKEDTPQVDGYIVTFNTDGGSNIDPIKVKKDEKVNRPTDPTKENNKFLGWYEDSSFTNVFNFSTPITKDITIYAKWEKTEKPIQKKDAQITSFSIVGTAGSINHSTGKIYIDLPNRIDLNNLVPVIAYSEGATISPSVGASKNFNQVVNYTVSGEGFNASTYGVYVNIPSEKEYEKVIDQDPNWYRERYRRRDDKDWYEITQKIKKKRLEEEKGLEKTSKEGKNVALNEVGRITSQSGKVRRDLFITQFGDYMEVRLNSMGRNDDYRSQINIPTGVLTELKELKFDYLKYSTDLVRINIYPFMDSSDGVRINLKSAPSEPNNDIQYIWSKIKGAGKVFEIESNSTKAGISLEMKLDKNLPAEYIRVVKYNYMMQKFEDLEPEKWSVMGGHVYVEQVSGGVYGIIYKR